MKPNEMILRCYAEKQAGEWVAVCIDLGLAAQGESADEVRAKLHEMIESYVIEALTVDKLYFDQLLSRKAPFNQRIRYHWLSFRASCNAVSQKFKTFLEVLPLTPSRV